MTGARIATIGHSNRPQGKVLDMLQAAGVGLLVDVRAFPRSRTNPDFNIDCFPQALGERQIAYRHDPALGGRRNRQPQVGEKVNALWRERSFHNFADYAMGPTFTDALDRLIAEAADRRVALMCSEAVWWRCHRRIITDHLLLAGHPVEHLMAPGRTERAKPTPGAGRLPDGRVVYAPTPDEPPLPLAPSPASR